MFTDYWVIAQLLAQASAIALLLYASVFGTKSLLYWAGDSDSALQIQLERRNYLMGAVMQMGLWFQTFSLLIFLHTANEHLPSLIKGAMCASGTLGVNDWGYPLLFLKSLAIFVYAVYGFVNYLDNREPAYPLTPAKYGWLYPALALSAIDMYMLVQYYLHIKPDLIATCCSVDFSAENRSMYAVGEAGRQGIWAFWVATFGLLLAYAWRGNRQNGQVWVAFLLGGVYVGLCLYNLKYTFVKYIYGLPSHLCLFDIFWGKYYAIGYLLFASYYALMLSLLGFCVLAWCKSRLTTPPTAMYRALRLGLWGGLLLSFCVPYAYWALSGYSF